MTPPQLVKAAEVCGVVHRAGTKPQSYRVYLDGTTCIIHAAVTVWTEVTINTDSDYPCEAAFQRAITRSFMMMPDLNAGMQLDFIHTNRCSWRIAIKDEDDIVKAFVLLGETARAFYGSRIKS